MELSLVLEQRFVRSPDGRIWTHGPLHAEFWQRYLRDFESLKVIARVHDEPEIPEGWREVLRDRVHLHPIPGYIGPLQFLRQRRAVIREMRAALNSSTGALILRTPGNLSALAGRMLLSKAKAKSKSQPESQPESQSKSMPKSLLKLKSISMAMSKEREKEKVNQRSIRPFGVEVVGDPQDVFAPEAISHPLRPFFRQHFSKQQRILCKKASAALYVSEHQLPKRYPCSGFSTFASNVELLPESFATGPRVGLFGGEYRSWGEGSRGLEASESLSEPGAKLESEAPGVRIRDGQGWYPILSREEEADSETLSRAKLRVIFVGTLEQLYKGPDVLLKAMAICRSHGVNIHATLVGEGRRQRDLEKLARDLKLLNHLHFTGFLPSPEAVRSKFAQADAFILPSRTEGLPRAMLEAMAQGLPCVGSNAGGIPELLPAEAMCEPGDEAGLSVLLLRLVRDSDYRHRLSIHGLATAQRYREEILDSRRRAFYRALIEASV